MNWDSLDWLFLVLACICLIAHMIRTRNVYATAPARTAFGGVDLMALAHLFFFITFLT